MTVTRLLSTAEQRRPVVIDAAIHCFAKTGYRGTTIADIATEAGISPAYVFRLFEDKQNLFISALSQCFEQVRTVFAAGADEATSPHPDDVLASMGLAYARLIADRKLMMLQIHALAASDEPSVQQALREGYQLATEFVTERSGADTKAIQNFFAFGQLCHLVTALGLIDDSSIGAQSWAQMLSAGLRHFPPDIHALT